MPVEQVRDFVRRISSKDSDEYPNWDPTKPLPRLPVPELHSTLATYLKLVEPVVSEERLANTKRIVQEFLQPGGVGEKLQKHLVETARTKENWVSDWWLDDMYLFNHLPLPVNSNPGLVFPSTSFESDREQLRFAAQLIVGIFDYKTILDDRKLPVERVRHHKKGQPLCMEQYYRLFSSYRRPGIIKDQQVLNLDRDPFDPEYVIVACNDQFYALNAMAGCNDFLTEEAIYGQLRRIVKDASECAQSPKPPPRVGVLTSMQRDLWARAREHLAQDETNRANLELIERSCFIVCLDKDSNQQEQQELQETAAVGGSSNDVKRSLQLLHGMGSRHNGANRWYDKTMQFVISADGNSGLNYEHSVSEGIAVIKLIEHILAYMDEMKAKRMRRFPSICELPHPQKLEWHVDAETESFIEQGLVEIDKLMDNLDLYILRFDKFGREYPKKANMSPDSFVQLALQLAHYKVHKYLVPTYESASIRRFHLGRVDVIHSASMAALHWVRAMEGDFEATAEQKLRLLREAIECQTEHMLKTILGHGVDNHMLGLRITAETVLGQLPELFTDPVYVECNQFRLSTSQVSTTTDALICYGAVVPNGYGAAYNLHTDSIAVCVSCWRGCPNKDVSACRYAEALAASLEDMYAMIEANLDLARVNSVATDVKIPEESSDVGAGGSVNGESLQMG